jgi:membrane-bound lytic murein transglycosylase F
MKIISSVFFKIYTLFFLVFTLFSCDFQQKKGDEKNEILVDTLTSLDKIRDKGKLVAVTNYNLVNYYIYKGEPAGYQYELLKNFANDLGVGLEFILEENIDKSLEMLTKQEVDIAAMGLTTTKQRKQHYDFTNPIIVSRIVLVQAMPKGWQYMRTRDEIENNLLRSTLDLSEKTVYVAKGSLFKSYLEALSDFIGDTIYIIEDSRSVDELMLAVANGEIQYTIADEYIALVYEKVYSNIDIKTPLSYEQKISWTIRKEARTTLLDTINIWLENFMRTSESRYIYNKYFKSQRATRLAKKEFNSLESGHLSIYDSIIQSVAKSIDWDWRLLASLICQESDFNPLATSHKGAYGLMQLTSAVMEQYGIDSTASPNEQIAVGGTYLRDLDKQLPASITDSVERIKFVLASYNAGVGHVLDARRLAEKHERNPDIWTSEVDYFMLKKSEPEYYRDSLSFYGYAKGSETFNFVEQIFDRYEHYRILVKE